MIFLLSYMGNNKKSKPKQVHIQVFSWGSRGCNVLKSRTVKKMKLKVGS